MNKDISFPRLSRRAAYDKDKSGVILGKAEQWVHSEKQTLHTLNVIVGPPGYRHLGELRHFVGLRHFKTVFVTSRRHIPLGNIVSHKFVTVRKLLPDFITERFVRRPYGPVSLLEFGMLDTVSDADLFNSPELYSFASNQSIRATIERNAKLSISSWETIPRNPLLLSPPYSFNVSRLKKRADLFLVPTRLAARCLLKIGCPPDKVKVLRPGVDSGFLSSATTEHEGFRILFVGRLDPEKGIRNLLQAFVEFYRLNNRAELWLCGPTRSGGAVEVAARSLASRIPITLLGELSQDALKRVYSSCDVFCLPSVDRWKWGFKVWEEQFGWALVEAMANGLPIVATDCGAVREVIGSQNLIVRQNAVSDLVDGFMSLWREKGTREMISELNRERASIFHNLEKQRLELDQIFVELLESRK